MKRWIAWIAVLAVAGCSLPTVSGCAYEDGHNEAFVVRVDSTYSADGVIIEYVDSTRVCAEV